MLKRMVVNIGGVSFILTAIMVLASLSSLLLANILTPVAFGEFGLLRTLILLMSTLAIWGQGIAAARYFSNLDVTQYRWDIACRKIMRVSILLISVFVILAYVVYRLNTVKIIALFIATISYCTTLYLSNLVRSQGLYKQAILMNSGFRGLFVFCLLIVFLITRITSVIAIYCYVTVIVLTSAINVWYVLGKIPTGSRIVPNEMHRTGLVLAGIEGSIAIMSYVDGLFIAKMLNYEALALYTATVVPVQVFAILTRAAKYVWVPEFGKNKHVHFRWLCLGVAFMALFLLLFYFFAAESIMDILYRGKYNSGASLLRLLAVVGVLRLFYSLFSSWIIGRLENKALHYHLGVTVITMVLYMIVLYVFIGKFGVYGVGLALLILFSTRVIGSYFIVNKFQKSLALTKTKSISVK